MPSKPVWLDLPLDDPHHVGHVPNLDVVVDVDGGNAVGAQVLATIKFLKSYLGEIKVLVLLGMCTVPEAAANPVNNIDSSLPILWGFVAIKPFSI